MFRDVLKKIVTRKCLWSSLIGKNGIFCASIGSYAAAVVKPVANKSELKSTISSELKPAECIKQACLVNANAATSLLTSTVAAVVDTSMKYKEILTALIVILQNINLQGIDDKQWDSVVELRHLAQEHHSELNRLILFMENVNKVVEASIEAAFNADANYVCKTLCERSHAAAEEVNRCKQEIEDLEKHYLQIQVEMTKIKQNEEQLKEKQ